MDEQLKLLQKIGFSEYESRAYVSLARLGPSTVSEVSIDSKIPRSKTYEVLETLEAKGRVMTLPITPKKYKIANSEKLRDEAKKMVEMTDSLISLIQNPSAKEYNDLFWVIKGRQALLEKFTSVNQQLKHEIVACSNLDKKFYQNMRILEGKITKGASVKFITLYQAKNADVYAAWRKIGAQVRFYDTKKFGPLLPRFSVQDGKMARITLGLPEVPDEENYITLWTESKAFCMMLKNQFEYLWKHSMKDSGRRFK